ncbi:phosphate-starvation-inducible PsiE family protein [Phormidium sp. LEGE 05292]|uniref:phosphate-starvation-inducible PsiE family protein n=1 Tax=[Phormidium] sp. LEGE 05292 TaxID=767427 RepID=UPI0018803A9C|nr:phosphate-starvation-inducible PsiE family protein [Phormidium sp. LEGE 05292]MBE9225730.1 phosphate-starvation-inducible PsiE family protein [Phormidium sp. LEGE 05292]
MYKVFKNEQTSGGWLNKGGIVRVLETIQDLLIISLCIGLFTLMAIQLRAMFFELLPPLNFKVVTSDILFLLILVELFRLLIIYLQEQRVSIGVAVEVSIVSVLREVLVRGVLEAHWTQILSACAFLIVMAILLIVRAWLPPTFSGIDPEKMISLRYKGKEANESSEMVMKQQEDYKMPANILDSNSNVTSEHH